LCFPEHTELGGGWVAAEDLADLTVSEAQAGHNTMYVQPYTDEKGEWVNSELAFPEFQEFAFNIEKDFVTEDTPLSDMFSFTLPTGIAEDETWFKVQVGGEDLEIDLGKGWVRGDNLADFNFSADDAGSEISVTPFFNDAKQDAETWTVAQPQELTTEVDDVTGTESGLLGRKSCYQRLITPPEPAERERIPDGGRAEDAGTALRSRRNRSWNLEPGGPTPLRRDRSRPRSDPGIERSRP